MKEILIRNRTDWIIGIWHNYYDARAMKTSITFNYYESVRNDTLPPKMGQRFIVRS